MPNKMTKNEVLQKFHKKHQNKYDYSNFLTYKNINQKIGIVCRKHGIFSQLIKHHINGNGCPKCSSVHKYSTQEFIEKSKKVHQNFYSYDKTVYVNKKTKVCIICPEHGEFNQNPYDHIKGHGCPKCANNNKKSYNQFLKEVTIVHKNKYNYPSNIVNFCNNKKIPIKCPEHGEFYQIPKDHLNGHGCPECAKEQNKLKRTLSQKQFLKNAKKIHQDKYNYSLSLYNGAHRKISIVCPEHGEFYQSPHNHISMHQGCPKCQNIISVNETNLLNFIQTNYHKEIII